MNVDASRALTPMGTSPVITPNSPSKSIPSSSRKKGTSSEGPRKSSEPPWYNRGYRFKIRDGLAAKSELHQVPVIQEGGAVAPLISAWQRCGTRLGRKCNAAIDSTGVQRVRPRHQLGRNFLPTVQRILKRLSNRARTHGSRQVARHDHQVSIARTIFQGCELHFGPPPALGGSGGAPTGEA